MCSVLFSKVVPADSSSCDNMVSLFKYGRETSKFRGSSYFCKADQSFYECSLCFAFVFTYDAIALDMCTGLSPFICLTTSTALSSKSFCLGTTHITTQYCILMQCRMQQYSGVYTTGELFYRPPHNLRFVPSLRRFWVAYGIFQVG